MSSLHGKVAIITGASRGFGFAVAHQFALAGAKIVVSSRAKSSVDKAVLDFQDKGFEVTGIVCDISKRSDIENLANQTISTYGHFDIWINNAAQPAPYGPTLDIPVHDFESVFQTNILGTYYGCIVALRHFLDRDQGKLINILGAGDRRNHPMQNAYSSTKAWEIRFTKTLALEYKNNNVGIYGLNPGMMATEMLTNITVIKGHEDNLNSLEKVIRVLSNPPEKPAQKAVWLASSQTDGKTGLIIHQTSGFTILKGVIREMRRRVFKNPAEPIDIVLTSIPSGLTHELDEGKHDE